MKKITFLLFCLMTITFANAQTLTSVAIVGDGAGGWPLNTAGEVDAHQMTSTDGENWTFDNLTVTSGYVKFRGNNSWDLPYNWGGSDFPSGTSVVNAGGIPSTAGIYDVTFNSTTGVYSFVADTSLFPTISVIGTATPGGETTDTDMLTIDGDTYTLTLVALTPGWIKFRQNHEWDPTANWGGTDFPMGTGIVDSDAITVPSAGTYNITFNKTSLAYNFWFSTVALVGAATPGGWPTGAAGEVDPGVMTTTDGIMYTLDSIVLTMENCKFRSNNSWVKQWGGATDPSEFPVGMGTQTGNDIYVNPASTYSVTLNAETGAYAFTNLLSAPQFSASDFKVYPNPTNNSWNFSVANAQIQSIQIADLTGKTVLSVTPNNSEATVDASSLSSGMYFAKVATATSANTIKLVKN
jgi:hypothetical protein